nr:tetratricopeptide repeat protein [candidate division Zixibacteria bacterium]
MKQIAGPPSEYSGIKWVETLYEFLELARKASDSFDYERALMHLDNLEQLWLTKGLPAFSPELRYDLHHEKGKVLSRLGRYAEAVAQYQQLLEYCQDKNLAPRRVEVFLEIGQLLAKTGELDRALGYVHRALAGNRRLNDPLGICKSLRNLGAIYIELGEFDDAEAAYEEGIGIALNNQLNLLHADLSNNLGTIKNIKGEWQAALECYKTARTTYESEGEVRKSAYTFNNIGITLMEQDDYEQAHQNYVAALRIADSIKDESLILILNINLTDLLLKIKNIPEARKYCLSAHQLIRNKGLKNSQLVETIKLAGKIALFEENYNEALARFNEARDLCEELGLQFLEAEILFEIGSLCQMTEQHMQALQILEQAFQLFHQLNVTGRLEKTRKLICSVEDLYLKVFEAMASQVDQKDPYTKGHSDRVANLALFIARKLGLSDHETKSIVAAGLLHDIGKLQVPDEILKKPGRLTPAEFDEIKKHPDTGIRILAGIKLPWEVIPLIRHHHEKFNGEGYPSGLSGDNIPIGARVICVADVFDALTSARPYRKAFDASKAIGIMEKEMIGSFDPVVLETLIELITIGEIDHIINRQTDADEMYKIWAQCRFTPNRVESLV